jgi:hypothetical protein
VAVFRLPERAEGGDQAVALEEAPLRGRGEGRQLGDDRTGLRDALDQVLVASGVGAVDSTREDRDGAATGGEGGAVGHAVDAVGGTGDDGVAVAVLHEVVDDGLRDVLAVAGRGTCADDRDGVGVGEHPFVAADEERDRSVVAEVEEGGGVARVGRGQHRDAAALDRVELAVDLEEGGDAQLPSGDVVEHLDVLGIRGDVLEAPVTTHHGIRRVTVAVELGDEAHECGVARLGEVREDQRRRILDGLDQVEQDGGVGVGVGHCDSFSGWLWRGVEYSFPQTCVGRNS